MTNSERQDDLLAKHEMLIGVFSEFHGEVDESRRYYDLNFRDRIVPDRWRSKLEPYIPPNAAHAIDEAVDHILFTPRIRVMTRPAEAERSLEEQDIAENKRAFLSALWANETVLHDARKTLLNEGMVAIKKTINWHYVPKNPGKGSKKSVKDKYRRELAKLGNDKKLWSFEVLDNKTLTYGPVASHRDPMYAYLKYEITVEEARALFPRPGDPVDGMGARNGGAPPSQSWRDMPDLQKVEYVEFWSRNICDENGDVIEPGAFIQWVDKEVVVDVENPYSYIPIAIEDSGYGTVRSTSTPADIFVGMTKKMRSVFVNQARQFTAWEAVNELTAFGLYTARNRDPQKVWNVGPGEILDLEGDEGQPGAEMLTAVKLPDIPIGVIQLVQETNRLANSVLKTDTLGGQPLPGVETASEADQQIRNASAKLASPVAALERIAAKLSQWVLMDIEDQFEAPVTIWAVPAGSDAPSSMTVKPTDIRGYYLVTAELRTTDQEAVNMVKARFWAEMYRLIPFLSAWTAMERGEISEEPQRELVRRASEDVYLSEEMSMVRKLTAAQSFGEFAALIQQMVAGAGGEGAGGAGAAPGGNGDAGGFASQPVDDMMNPSVPAAQAGSAGAARDILQGPSMIRG